MMQPTLEEFQEWRQHPVTKAFLKSLHNAREELKEGLATGAFENVPDVQGRCSVVANILSMNYEDMVEDLKHG